MQQLDEWLEEGTARLQEVAKEVATEVAEGVAEGVELPRSANQYHGWPGLRILATEGEADSLVFLATSLAKRQRDFHRASMIMIMKNGS